MSEIETLTTMQDAHCVFQMAQAYRLLAEEMYSKGWDYPLHLGVTEVRHHASSACSNADA